MTLYGIQYNAGGQWEDDDRDEDHPVRYGSSAEAHAALDERLADALKWFAETQQRAEEADQAAETVKKFAVEKGLDGLINILPQYWRRKNPRDQFRIVEDREMDRSVEKILEQYGTG